MKNKPELQILLKVSALLRSMVPAIHTCAGNVDGTGLVFADKASPSVDFKKYIIRQKEALRIEPLMAVTPQLNRFSVLTCTAFEVCIKDQSK